LQAPGAHVEFSCYLFITHPAGGQHVDNCAFDALDKIVFIQFCQMADNILVVQFCELWVAGWQAPVDDIHPGAPGGPHRHLSPDRGACLSNGRRVFQHDLAHQRPLADRTRPGPDHLQGLVQMDPACPAGAYGGVHHFSVDSGEYRLRLIKQHLSVLSAFVVN